MTEPVIENLAEALRDREHPAVGLWNRVEGRPRTTDFARALRAEVHDPLWMLTRQWQLGEFTGSDAGSPVTATYAVNSAPPTRFSPGDVALTGDRPLETVAERRPLPFRFGAEPIAFDLRLALGRRWLRLLDQSIILRALNFRQQYLQRYPIALPDPGSSAEDDLHTVAHPEVWATLQALAGRRMDGYLLYQHLKAGGHASDGIDDLLHLHRAELDALGVELVAWFDELIDQPADDGSWDARRLEHSFKVSALVAPEYPGGELDWHAFSADHDDPLDGAVPTLSSRTVFPAPVRYSGMPLPRWWAVEDGETNLAAVTPDSTDLARLIFLEFALVFSNDWYQLPCDLPAGVVASIQGLVVTDVFGQRQWITAAGGPGEPWSMFTLSDASDARLVLPLGTPKVATGPALEDVYLVRDENANLVWGIETTVRMDTGEGRRGDEVAAETLAQRRRLHPATPPDDPRAAVAYEVMSSVPENWIPFIPVHVPGDNRSVQLQRAAMPSEVDAAPVRPRTTLLREGLDAGRSYFVNEEEVPRVGTRLTLAYNRTRWRDGRPVVWLSIRRGAGRGERSSGLAFDLLDPSAAGELGSHG
jgi:hypothetical protein